jgi:histidine triad (HIT) family protein
MVPPRAHRQTVAELRSLIGRSHGPDGWNVGWNVDSVGGRSIPHAHCHLLPRYRDEPYTGRGIRAWLKDPGGPAAAGVELHTMVG